MRTKFNKLLDRYVEKIAPGIYEVSTKLNPNFEGEAAVLTHTLEITFRNKQTNEYKFLNLKIPLDTPVMKKVNYTIRDFFREVRQKIYKTLL